MRQKIVLPPEQVVELRKRVNEGGPKAKLAREFRVSRETYYQYLRVDPTQP
ncbi:helix-turn-helix domain-containing protein [Chitinimonas sp. PSY-7]|uniref:helix-turn-helix domain-containing protein n=1 Tax=Chitinimonas sp. PSY-7 TaxID=3459088 RepID=UPI00403FD5C4